MIFLVIFYLFEETLAIGFLKVTRFQPKDPVGITESRTMGGSLSICFVIGGMYWIIFLVQLKVFFVWGLHISQSVLTKMENPTLVLLMMQPIRIYPHSRLFDLAVETGLIVKDAELIEGQFWNPGSLSYAAAGVQAGAQTLYKLRKSVRDITGKAGKNAQL